jgi:hypothetical protein
MLPFAFALASSDDDCNTTAGLPALCYDDRQRYPTSLFLGSSDLLGRLSQHSYHGHETSLVVHIALVAVSAIMPATYPTTGKPTR